MNEARSQIGFEQSGLGGILRQYKLEVPLNQREYAWTDEEVKELLQDLAKAILSGGDYFLGTIVTIPRRNGVLEVVDGQQRLATTALLLTAIRDYLIDKNEPWIVDSLNQQFLATIDRERRASVPNLRLNTIDNDLFASLITGDAESRPEPVRESHKLLMSAYRQAARQVRSLVAAVDPREHGNILNGWVSFIEHNAMVVLLRVPRDSDAYKMFETLNDRGLHTSQVDLIKNYLFGQSNNRLPEVQERWSYMRGVLDTVDDDAITLNFLRHAIIVLRGHVTANDVYETVQEIARGEQGVITFSAALENLSRVYAATFYHENELWNEYPDAVRRAIEVFNLINIRPLRPLILALAARMEKEETAKAFQFLISLTVRVLITTSTRSGSFEIPVATAAHNVFDGTITTAKQLKEALSPVTPRDDQFRQAFEIARVSTAKYARYYLRSLETHAKDSPDPWFIPQDDRSVINLEHILPEKPEENWPAFTSDEVGMYGARIGNMALMRAGDNADLKSKPFSEKKQVYAASPYVLTSQMAEAEDWTPAVIIERQARLAELAVKTWPI